MNDWIISFVKSMGAPGIGLLMFAENLFPPLPSEFIMPLAGYLSTQGSLSFMLAVAAGIVGSALGAVFWYGVGYVVTERKLRSWIRDHGAWLGLRLRDVDRSDRFFRKHGKAAVFFGRLLPVVRTLISVPAGLSRMSFLPFLFYTVLGTAIWTAALAYAGRFLGQQFPQISSYLGPIAWVIIGAAVVAYVVRVVRIRRGL